MNSNSASEMILNIGPHNSPVNGSLKLITELKGEIINSAESVIGFSHRGIEKIAENCTYLRYLPLAAKIDSLCGFTYQEAYCSAVEKLCEFNVPERAQYIRVLLLEMNRISSHLFHLASYLLNLGAKAQFYLIFEEREKILDIFKAVCGKRLLCNYHVFGGVKHDLNNNILNRIADFASEFPEKVKEFQELTVNNPVFISRTLGLGIITKNRALSYGLTGSNLRSSGISLDFRKAKPYLVYDRLEFEVPTEYTGDCHSRCLVRIREIMESLKIVMQCCKFLIKSSAPYKNNDINSLKIIPSADTAVSYVESPRGILSCTIISDGSDTPARVKWRTPSFYAIQILPELLKNKYLSDLVPISGSLDIVVSEADR